MNSKTTCEDFSEIISAFIDKEASPEETELLRAHLAECGSCREKLASLEKLRGLLKELPPVTGGSALKERIVSNVPKKKDFSPLKLVPSFLTRPQPFITSIAAAAAIVIALIGYRSVYLPSKRTVAFPVRTAVGKPSPGEAPKAGRMEALEAEIPPPPPVLEREREFHLEESRQKPSGGRDLKRGEPIVPDEKSAMVRSSDEAPKIKSREIPDSVAEPPRIAFEPHREERAELFEETAGAPKLERGKAVGIPSFTVSSIDELVWIKRGERTASAASYHYGAADKKVPRVLRLSSHDLKEEGEERQAFGGKIRSAAPLSARAAPREGEAPSVAEIPVDAVGTINENIDKRGEFPERAGAVLELSIDKKGVVRDVEIIEAGGFLNEEVLNRYFKTRNYKDLIPDPEVDSSRIEVCLTVILKKTNK